MKVQIDENRYLTGSYCTVGGLDNSIEMKSLPECNPIYYMAYKIMYEQLEHKFVVAEEILKEREVNLPVLDEEGNETGETYVDIEYYYEVEPIEKVEYEDRYYYELDEAKKKEIDKALEDLSIKEPEKNTITIEDLSNKITSIQMALCDIYEGIESK